MTVKTVNVVNDFGGVSEMFNQRHDYFVTQLTDQADVVVFTGGADVSPHLYGEKAIEGTCIEPSRDFEELAIYHSLHPSTLKVGICRGGQFLNVINGGKMWQDVDGHATGMNHDMMITETGQVISVTSTHHQMMIPADHAKVLAVANEANIFKRHGCVVRGKAHMDKWEDIEVVFYPDTNCLCFQPHPEYQRGPMREYFFRLLKEYNFVDKAEREELAKKVKEHE